MGWIGASEVPLWSVQHVNETGSTNADLLALARAGAPEGTVLVADHQTAGRGRRDRVWLAPPRSSLLASILVRPRLAAARLAVVTQAVAIAAADACVATAGVRAELKWPNDLLVGSRKLAGVLAESVLDPTGAVSAVVVGIGLNVSGPPGDSVSSEWPAGATALELEAGRPIERDDVLAALLDGLARLDQPTVTRRYRAELGTLGREVRVELPDGSFAGRAEDVRADGALVVLLPDGSRRSVTAGDVVHLRPAGKIDET
jgi:BirA family biotin operon repressor/biotin-[acetyl-CoA-carboxylase] ligase